MGHRLLLWLEPGIHRIAGGHLVQLRSIADQLGALGHSIVLSADGAVDPGDFDAVVCMGLTREQLERVDRAGTPLLVFTIWWRGAFLYGPGMDRWSSRTVYRQARRRAADAYRRLRGDVERTTAYADRRLFRAADVLMPNSPSEGRTVQRQLRPNRPMQVVPNGVDVETFRPHPESREHFVLSVGRIEPLKNQLGTIRSLRRTGWRVVLVGDGHPDHPDYLRQVQAELRPTDQWLGPVDPEQLAELYRKASVHVLNSWFETTGLVSLEAAACGTPVVSTRRGFARDYFQDLADYCDPARPHSLLTAVEAAAGRDTAALTERVRSAFTWAKAAERVATAADVAVGRQGLDALSADL